MEYVIKPLTIGGFVSLHRMYNSLSKSSKRNFQPGFLGKPMGLKWFVAQVAVLASCMAVLRRILLFLYPRAVFFSFIAVNKERKVIGFAFLKLRTNNRKHLSADLGVVVTDNYHNKGIGSNLMDHLIQIAKVWGIKTILLIVLRDNIKAIRLYHKYGFVQKQLVWIQGCEYLEMYLNLEKPT